MIKKRIVIIGALLCFLVYFIVSVKSDRCDNSDIRKGVELIESSEQTSSKKSSMQQNFIPLNENFKSQQTSGEIEKDKEDKITKTDIKSHDSFVQIETESIHKRIAFPSIDIVTDEDAASFINEQIYHEIISKDFWEYGNGREDTDIQYEVEFAGNEIVSIHFHGYQSYMGSYAEYNRGMNFNLRTGRMISLKDYYMLSDIKAIIMNANDCKEIAISDFLADEEEMKRQIDKFVSLFDSEKYIGRTDNFFIKGDCIYFIMPPIESMRESIYIELSLDKFSKLYQ